MNALVESARTYIRTPFTHQGRSRDGIDCAGLVWASYNDLGVVLPDYRRYGREPHRDGLVAHVTAALGAPLLTAPVAMAQLQPGDVLVLKFQVEPHHMGIVGEKDYGGTRALTLIHADGEAPPLADGEKGRVLEVRLIPQTVARITHVFRKPC